MSELLVVVPKLFEDADKVLFPCRFNYRIAKHLIDLAVLRAICCLVLTLEPNEIWFVLDSLLFNSLVNPLDKRLLLRAILIITVDYNHGVALNLSCLRLLSGLTLSDISD